MKLLGSGLLLIGNLARSIKMKKATKIGPLVLGVLLSTRALSASTVLVALDTPYNNFNIGEFVTVRVVAFGVFDSPHVGDTLTSFGFDFTNTNPAALAFIGYDVAPWFADHSPLPGTQIFATTAGAGSSLPGNNMRLAFLFFQAVGLGSSTVSINSSLLDPNEGLRYGTTGAELLVGSSQINVTDTPEVSTAYLVGAGLTVLLIGHNRRLFARQVSDGLELKLYGRGITGTSMIGKSQGKRRFPEGSDAWPSYEDLVRGKCGVSRSSGACRRGALRRRSSRVIPESRRPSGRTVYSIRWLLQSGSRAILRPKPTSGETSICGVAGNCAHDV